MPEVHFVGQILGCSDFDQRKLCCQWKIVTDSEHWNLLEGMPDGQTHVDDSQNSNSVVWCHPFDIHYAVTSVEGWPKIRVEVYHLDFFGRYELSGYGTAHLPTAPGNHTIDIVTWRPRGTFSQEMSALFLGGYPQLKNPDIISGNEDRYGLKTDTAGVLYMEVNVLLRGFENKGVIFNT